MVEYIKGELCKWCRTEGRCHFTLTPKNIHYGRIDCDKCSRWVRWIKNSESNRDKEIRDGTSIFTKEEILAFHEKEKEICFFCLREKSELGFKEVMTIDHIEELSKGGKDEIGNLQLLCSACHKLKNWARTYMNWHMKGDEVI